MVEMVQRLDDVDLDHSLSRVESEERLVAAHRHLLHLRLVTAGLLGDGSLGPGILVLMEGWDASGKGGAIRRLVAPLDPRHVTVAPFGTPTDREARHHFLWRYFPSIPGLGGMSVFDRSWYGRVLVERVEKIASKEAWQRAYSEINGFEESLSLEGVVVIKIFLHISDAEQLRRFEARREDSLKSWKLTDEDWRNRSQRAAYEVAIDDVLTHTDTDLAPWHVIPAESKHYARVAVVETVIAQIERGMRRHGLEPPVSQGRDYGI
jgi:polyphosphate kinase 2 (PPK2 family)